MDRHTVEITTKAYDGDAGLPRKAASIAKPTSVAGNVEKEIDAVLDFEEIIYEVNTS
jgi:hypothetical protein